MPEWRGIRRVMVGGVATKHLDTLTHSLNAATHVNRGDYDVALVSIAGNVPVALMLKARRIPVVFNVDGTDSEREKWSAPARLYLRATESLAARAAHVVVTDAEWLRVRYETTAAPVRVIPYGCERATRPPGDELALWGLEPDGYLLHVGRMEPEYGALDIVRAHARIESRPPLVVVGDAPYAHDYKARVHQAATKEVVFTGARYGDAYEELMSNARALVVAVREGGTHPLVVEGMGFGLPVVAPDTPVMREVLGTTALYHSTGDELTTAMDRVWQAATWARTLGDQARARAHERYSWDAVATRYEEAFAEAVRRSAGRGRGRPARGPLRGR